MKRVDAIMKIEEFQSAYSKHPFVDKQLSVIWEQLNKEPGLYTLRKLSNQQLVAVAQFIVSFYP